MKFSKFVNELAQNSDSLSLDYYIQGLKRFTKYHAINNNLGNVELTKLNIKSSSYDLNSLLLGETNRSSNRYYLIQDLLNKYSKTNFIDSLYYKKLYNYYSKKNVYRKCLGFLEIKRKVHRIFEISKYLAETNTFNGLTSYINNSKNLVSSRLDYPISIKIDTNILFYLIR